MKQYKWVEDERGNLITDDGRFTLKEIPSPMPLEESFGEKKLDQRERGEKTVKLDTSVSFFESVQQKIPAVKNLVVGVVDLFTKGAASKIEQSVNQIFGKEKIEENVYKQNGGGMFSTIKTYAVGYLTKALLLLGGGALVKAGATEQDLAELAGGVVAVVLAVGWQLITHNVVALKDPKEFLKLK